VLCSQVGVLLLSCPSMFGSSIFLVEPVLSQWSPVSFSLKFVLFFCLNVHDEHSFPSRPHPQNISCGKRHWQSSHAFPVSP
jgi:hypothetical protein